MTLPILTAPNLESIAGLIHGFTTREGGVSEGPYASLNLGWATGDEDEAVEENYRRLAGALKTNSENFRGSHQVHGAGLVHVESAGDRRSYMAASADALVTAVPGVVLNVRVADCFPILLADPAHRAVGVVHAGWRGTLAKVLPAAISEMSTRFHTSPSDLSIALGPGIGLCCFEVSSAIALLFEQEVGLEKTEWRESGASANLDLARINTRLAQVMGVASERIWRSGQCTACRADKFFSYRRDGKRSGRMVGAIGWSA